MQSRRRKSNKTHFFFNLLLVYMIWMRFAYHFRPMTSDLLYVNWPQPVFLFLMIKLFQLCQWEPLLDWLLCPFDSINPFKHSCFLILVFSCLGSSWTFSSKYRICHFSQGAFSGKRELQARMSTLRWMSGDTSPWPLQETKR